MPDMAYEVRLENAAQDDFAALDKSLQKQARKMLGKLREKPELGSLLGHRLGLNLTGWRSMHFATPIAFAIGYLKMNGKSKSGPSASAKVSRSTRCLPRAFSLGEVEEAERANA